jgi:hypothetical protein
MRQKTTVHTFRGHAFHVAVRKNHLNGDVTLAVLPADGDRQKQLHLFALECRDAGEATELAQLLKSAAAMAGHLREGGQVEIWRL